MDKFCYVNVIVMLQDPDGNAFCLDQLRDES